MALLFEALTSLVGLALKPLVIAKVTTALVVQTWFELLKFALSLHLVVLWRLLMCVVALLALPVRAVLALYRERMLEMQLHRLLNELENAIWDRRGLEEQLNVAIKERKSIETMLAELEDEHDAAILKIKTLENEVHNLRHETHRLEEIHSKSLWNYTGRNDINELLGYSGQETIAKNLCDEATHNENIAKPCPYASEYMLDDNLSENRKIALLRSLFAVVLSLVVGFIVFESENLCMPLVVALLIVVVISLTSVFRLLNAFEPKRFDFDVVLLLSLNWFVLGLVMCPVLPMMARVVVPLGLSFMGRIFTRVGFFV